MIKGLEVLSGHYGVFNHFLYTQQNNPEKAVNQGRGVVGWNELVDGVDTDKIAHQLNEAGASYYVFTLMQGTEYLAAPNETFDRIAGTKPGQACSFRDLPLDLAKSLSRYGIKLFLYFTGDGPWKKESIGRKFGFVEPRENVSESFVEKWASVVEEYAVRYGNKISGWWFDGCYNEKCVFKFNYSDRLLRRYYDACRKGNPEAAVAFNNGIRPGFEKNFIDEDYIAGEYTDFNIYPENGKFADGALCHILAPLGLPSDGNQFHAWGEPGCKISKENLAKYIKTLTDIGAAVTVEIALNFDSTFDPDQLDALRYVKSVVHKYKQSANDC